MTLITSAICSRFNLTISLNNEEQAWLHVNETCWHSQAMHQNFLKIWVNIHIWTYYKPVVPFRASSSSSTCSNWALPTFTSGAEASASRRSFISSGWQALQRSLRLLLRSWRAKTANTQKKRWDMVGPASILCKCLEAKRLVIFCLASAKLWETFATRKSFKWLPKRIHHSPCITTLSIDLQEDIANPYLQAVQWHKQRKHRKTISTHNSHFLGMSENMIPTPSPDIFDHNFGVPTPESQGLPHSILELIHVELRAQRFLHPLCLLEGPIFGPSSDPQRPCTFSHQQITQITGTKHTVDGRNPAPVNSW